RGSSSREEERWIGCFHQELLATFNCGRDMIRKGCTCGYVERCYAVEPGGSPHQCWKEHCADTLAELCDMMKCAKPAPFTEIIVYGHCGGPGIGATKPGISFGEGKPRFDITGLNVKCFIAIEHALDKDGVLTLCSCGYRGQGDPKKWDQSLQDMAN